MLRQLYHNFTWVVYNMRNKRARNYFLNKILIIFKIRQESQKQLGEIYIEWDKILQFYPFSLHSIYRGKNRWQFLDNIGYNNINF